MDATFAANAWLLNGPSMTRSTDEPEVDEVVVAAVEEEAEIEDELIIAAVGVVHVPEAGALRQSNRDVAKDDDEARVEAEAVRGLTRSRKRTSLRVKLIRVLDRCRVPTANDRTAHEDPRRCETFHRSVR